jgi:hypothetical protein
MCQARFYADILLFIAAVQFRLYLMPTLFFCLSGDR